MEIMVKGMQGMGDTIYQRPFIKALAKKYTRVYVETSWPEFLEDLDGVYFIKSETSLRTQSKNVANQDNTKWVLQPKGVKTLTINYGRREIQTLSIPEAMVEQFGVEPNVWDLPVTQKSPVTKRKYAVIRPVTARSEWLNVARNCDPKYIVEASKILKEQGYTIVSVADLEEDKEWIVGQEPYSDIKFHKGELKIKDLVALTAKASVVVSAVGFMVPMTMALGTPYICIHGGNGGHNSSGKICNEILPINNKISWIEPDNFCMCTSMKHECNKTISNFEEAFREELEWVIK